MYTDEKGRLPGGLPRHGHGLLQALPASTFAASSPASDPALLAHLFRNTCRAPGITTKRTRHDRPHTNGKAERFLQTAIREWTPSHRYGNLR